MSPDESVGAKCCSTEAWNSTPLIGPSTVSVIVERRVVLVWANADERPEFNVHREDFRGEG